VAHAVKFLTATSCVTHRELYRFVFIDNIDTVLFKAEVTYDGSVPVGSIYLLEIYGAFGNAYTNEEGLT
jgi:hypothetical protein